MKRIAQEKIDHGYGRPFTIISQESVNLEGRVMKRSNTVEYDPREFMSQYKAEDFYLENILAAGAVDGLKEVRLVKGRLMDSEQLDEFISGYEDLMDNNLVEEKIS